MMKVYKVKNESTALVSELAAPLSRVTAVNGFLIPFLKFSAHEPAYLLPV